MAGRAPFLPEAISRYIAEHAVREPQVLRELRVDLVMLSVGDGVTLARKR